MYERDTPLKEVLTFLDEPLSVEPFGSIIRKKFKNQKKKMVRPWMKAKFKQFVHWPEPKKPKPIFAMD